MREILGKVLLGVAALCAVVAMAGVATVHAQSYQGPGSCLVVSNQTPYALKVTVATPSRYNDGTYWDAPAGTKYLETINNAPITTPDGHWYIHWEGSPIHITDTWVYYPDRNKDQGCNGSWVVTLS